MVARLMYCLYVGNIMNTRGRCVFGAHLVAESLVGGSGSPCWWSTGCLASAEQLLLPQPNFGRWVAPLSWISGFLANLSGFFGATSLCSLIPDRGQRGHHGLPISLRFPGSVGSRAERLICTIRVCSS